MLEIENINQIRKLRAVHWILSWAELPRLEGIQSYKHQLLINLMEKHHIPQKLFQDPITLPDNIICISSLLDPLFITQLRRRKTIFYVSQRSHELSWAQRQSSDFCHTCAEWISPSWIYFPENTFCLTEQPRGWGGSKNRFLMSPELIKFSCYNRGRCKKS